MESKTIHLPEPPDARDVHAIYVWMNTVMVERHRRHEQRIRQLMDDLPPLLDALAESLRVWASSPTDGKMRKLDMQTEAFLESLMQLIDEIPRRQEFSWG